MKSVTIYLIPIVLSFAVAATGFTHGTGDHAQHDKAPGIKAADAWIRLLDDGRYRASWKTAAQVFQGAVSPEQWEKTIKAVRGPLGGLLARNLSHERTATTLPGMPDGEYLVLRYIARYDHKASAVETVTVMKDAQGNWKVAGYYIK